MQFYGGILISFFEMFHFQGDYGYQAWSRIILERFQRIYIKNMFKYQIYSVNFTECQIFSLPKFKELDRKKPELNEPRILFAVDLSVTKNFWELLQNKILKNQKI